MGFALPPGYLNATKYTGDQISDVPCVTFPRAPTTTDINYPILTLWRNGNQNAMSPDMYGDLWYLAYFIGQSGTTYLAHWIKLTGGGGGGGTVVDLVVQAATPPGSTTVVPDGAGNIFVNGAAVVNHLVPVETHSRNVNTYNVEVQYSDDNASAQVNLNGLSHFDSAAFLVDPMSGFVTLSGGTGQRAITQVAVPSGVSPIQPDSTGLVNFTSSGGTVTITGSSASPNNHTINFDLMGGGAAVEKFTVQAADGSGSTTVTPNSGNIIVSGEIVTGHTKPIQTISHALHQYDVQVQYADSNADAQANKSGMAHFDSAAFTVDDTTGFVTLSGGSGNTALTKMMVDIATSTGVNPVVPTSTGLMTVTGAQVAAGTTANVIRTDTTAPNQYTIEVQRSTAVASPGAQANNGVCHFDSSAFTVASNGFVTLNGSFGPAITKIGVDTSSPPGTNPVVPDGTGKITVTGGQVAAATTPNVIQTDSLSANNYTIQVQRSSAVGASDVTKNGVSHFYNNDFSVDGNGFVELNRNFVFFNPTFSFSGNRTGIVYTTQNGCYSVIGNVVFFDIAFTISSKGSGVGQLRLDLPLPCTANHGMRVHAMFAGGGTLPTGTTYTVGNCEVGTSYITIGAFGSGVAYSNLTNANVANVAAIYAGGCYVTTT